MLRVTELIGRASDWMCKVGDWIRSQWEMWNFTFPAPGWQVSLHILGGGVEGEIHLSKQSINLAARSEIRCQWWLLLPHLGSRRCGSRRLLIEGIGGWCRWSTIKQFTGVDSPFSEIHGEIWDALRLSSGFYTGNWINQSINRSTQSKSTVKEQINQSTNQ
jgi:hypothetical protein